eukprot:16130234-Heterocapsa_arctica.AAC.1
MLQASLPFTCRRRQGPSTTSSNWRCGYAFGSAFETAPGRASAGRARGTSALAWRPGERPSGPRPRGAGGTGA